MAFITCQFCGDTYPDFDVAHACSKGPYAPKIKHYTNTDNPIDFPKSEKNQRLKELLPNPTFVDYQIPHDGQGADFYDEKRMLEYGKRVINECIKEIEFQYGGGNLMEDGVTHNPEWDNALECVSAMIRIHFEVEE